MKYTVLTGCLIFVTHLALCSDDTTTKAPAAAASAPAAANSFSGRVVETMNAGDYTYVQVDTGKGKNWAAAPRFPVKVGDTVAIAASMPMPKYHSKTLNRDFEVVYFTDQVMVNGARATAASAMTLLPKDHPSIDTDAGPLPQLPKDHPPIAATAPKLNLDLSDIKKAEGGKTVAEVYAEKASLSGKQVKVRGKVVKFNAMIMGKNWIHLRDGTGKEGSNDLLVTSASAAKVGDTVVATGVLSLNKDFGANYKYAVMIEDAKLVAE